MSHDTPPVIEKFQCQISFAGNAEFSLDRRVSAMLVSFRFQRFDPVRGFATDGDRKPVRGLLRSIEEQIAETEPFRESFARAAEGKTVFPCLQSDFS